MNLSLIKSYSVKYLEIHLWRYYFKKIGNPFFLFIILENYHLWEGYSKGIKKGSPWLPLITLHF